MSSKMNLWNPFKDLFNPTDIYTAQAPLLKLSLISGIVPYRIVNDGSARLQISVFGFTVLLIHLLLYGFCYVKTIISHDSIVSYFFKTEISVLGDTLQLCIGLIGIGTVLLYSLMKRQKFVQWFLTMHKIDEQLKEIGVVTDYQSTLKFIFFVLLVKFIFFNTYLIGSFVLFQINGINPNFACWIVFFMPHIFISIIVVLFICLVKQLKHRFLLINKVLKNLCQQNKLDSEIRCKIVRPCGICSFYSQSQRDINEVVAQVSTIHDDLCDACALIEEYFSAQMLTTVAIAFLIIVFNTYYILGAIFGNTTETTGQNFNNVEFITFFSYQIAVHFFSVVAIVYVSSAASRESKKTAICVHKLLNVTKNEPLKIQLANLSMQLVHRHIKFTACNMFTLDTSLIFTIVKALSTYVIILVQFSLSQDAKVEILRKTLEDVMMKMNNLTVPLGRQLIDASAET